jgi:acyl-CoA synthetase (AMP-forming)/AMP-acid ligase II
VIEDLLEAARQRPDHVAVISSHGQSTYAELADAARSVARGLVARSIGRFGVLDADPASVLALLAGAALAGAEACVYPVAATDDVVDDLCERLEHTVVVTSRTGLRSPTLAPAELATGHQAEEVPAPETRPVMVLTTGTSGPPRGVRHDWDRLVRGTRWIRPAHDQRWLLAYGLNQFGGLLILIHVLAAQATLVAAETFQPRDALREMRRSGVTHASGTPTFWRFLLNEIQSDGGPRPALRQITLSGEAVPSALLDRIHDVFPDAHVSQIYGATEFGQTVTVRDGRAGLPVSMLESGGDLEFKIVDGELWVRSTTAMLGYFKESAFAAEDWRGTGDLVEIVGDRVEFRGRTTDVINVGGVKVHPLPVEERVGRVPGVALARAFGRPNAMTGSIVAVEVVVEPGRDPEDIKTEIREACADLPPAARPRSIRVVETLPTTGSKIVRGVSQ